MSGQNEIDWSKAPEWAGAVVRCSTGALYWVTAMGEVSRRQPLFSNTPDDLVADMAKSGHLWSLVSTRPKETWNGEGLPPVGVPVEWMASNQHGWKRVTVLAYADNDAWMQPEDGPSFIVGNPAGFRPPRTPEQIAAEEREKAILQMMADGELHIAGAKFKLSIGHAEALYDAGYRKQESEK